MTGEPLLRVRDLQVEFPLARGVLRAVDGASFDVAPGEALGLVGESGSGKTMALRALVGLLPRGGADRRRDGGVRRRRRDRGRARIAGASCAGRPSSMIFQEPMTALNPVMRVGDQIAEEPLVRLGHVARRARRRVRSS